ncbi:MAG: CBS domain-containing protein [Cyanobacteria bacterium J06643_4]
MNQQIVNQQDSSSVTPSLESAINPQVLTVSPETSIANVIEKMSAVSQEVCAVDGQPSETRRRASCAIVLENQKVIGICTERDIVRLTASKLILLRSPADIPVRDIMTSPVKTLEKSAFRDIFAVLFLFRRYRIRHLPIVDDAQQLIGIVTPASIRQVLRPANLLKMRRVSDVMSQDVVKGLPTDVVMTLAKRMADNRVSCVVIVEADGEAADANNPVGIVTERDIVQFQSLGLNLQKVTAQEVMSAPLFLLDPKDSLWAAHEAMKERRVRRLVVSWNWGQGLGIVTQTSVLRVFDPIEMYGIIDSLQGTLDQLKTEDDKLRAEPSVEEVFDGVVSAIAAAQKHTQLTTLQKQKLQQAMQLMRQT